MSSAKPATKAAPAKKDEKLHHAPAHKKDSSKSIVEHKAKAAPVAKKTEKPAVIAPVVPTTGLGETHVKDVSNDAYAGEPEAFRKEKKKTVAKKDESKEHKTAAPAVVKGPTELPAVKFSITAEQVGEKKDSQIKSSIKDAFHGFGAVEETKFTVTEDGKEVIVLFHRLFGIGASTFEKLEKGETAKFSVLGKEVELSATKEKSSGGGRSTHHPRKVHHKKEEEKKTEVVEKKEEKKDENEKAPEGDAHTNTEGGEGGRGGRGGRGRGRGRGRGDGRGRGRGGRGGFGRGRGDGRGRGRGGRGGRGGHSEGGADFSAAAPTESS